MPKRNCDVCLEKHEQLRCPPCVDKTRINLVMNGLLTYVWSYVDEYAPGSLKDAVVKHFDPKDISEARGALQNAVCDITPPFVNLQGNRSSSNNREKHDIEADDICGAMKQLSKRTDREVLPLFVVADVRKIPKVAPEEHNHLNILEQVLKIQEQMSQMASYVEANRLQLVTHGTRLNDVDGQIANLEGKNTYANRAKASQSGTGNSNPVTVTLTKSATQPNIPDNPNPGRLNAPKTPLGNSLKPSDTQDAKAGQEAQNQIKRPSPIPNDRDNEGGQWQQQKNRKHRNVFVGSKNTGRLTAGPRQVDIKVWNISPDYNTDDIKAAAEAEGVTVHDVVMLSKPEWRTRSFKVTVDAKDKARVMSPELWDEGIKIGYFYPERKAKQQNTNDGN